MNNEKETQHMEKLPQVQQGGKKSPYGFQF